jgi:hypothetical protein
VRESKKNKSTRMKRKIGQPAKLCWEMRTNYDYWFVFSLLSPSSLLAYSAFDSFVVTMTKSGERRMKRNSCDVQDLEQAGDSER